jgi:hypothetical protein
MIMDKSLPHIKKAGKIYFWKYKTDGWLGSEWHITADRDGGEYLIRLLDHMEHSEFTCQPVIPLSPVTQNILRIPDYDSPYKDMAELRLIYQPFAPNYYDWHIVDNKKTVEIFFGKAMLAEWRRAMMIILKDTGNLPIGLDEDHTVFFWCLPH